MTTEATERVTTEATIVAIDRLKELVRARLQNGDVIWMQGYKPDMTVGDTIHVKLGKVHQLKVHF